MEILHFEHHRHLLSQLDYFSRDQAKLLVVVKYGVQVLNPEGVHGTVKHDPVSVTGLVCCRVSHRDRQDSVHPVTHLLVVSVQLANRDTLRIYRVDVDLGWL